MGIGFRPTKPDPCVYTHGSGVALVNRTLYVDDILITWEDPTLVEQKKKELKEILEMSDMGEVNRIHGMEVTCDYDEGTLAITQTAYVDNILERFGMQDANATHTPGYGPELSAEQPEDKPLGGEATKLYPSVTGRLLYLAQSTTHDLCYAVDQLTRACSKPVEIHMTAAKHALRCLRGTTDLPIMYKRGRFRMVLYTDASFGANPDSRKSTTGYLFFLGGGLISFGSKTQSLTAQSTVESKLQALRYGARKAVYFFSFLMKLGFKTFSLVPINSDSAEALNVAGNATVTSTIKHITLQFFFVRELIKRNKTTLHHKPTQQMLGDIGTKHLSKQRFRELLQQIKDFTC